MTAVRTSNESFSRDVLFRYTHPTLKFRSLIASVASLAVFAAPFSAHALTPNDTFYGRQWYLPQIHAEEAWDLPTGSPVIVAVVDTSMDIDHEDLKENVWTNGGEVFGNGKDDDGNGFVDDIHGWNFLNQSNDVRPTGAVGTDHGRVHATLVASLIAAKGNNGIGVAGIAWNARIMPLVALDADGSGKTSDVADAIRYAANNGARIINLSLEGYREAQDVDEAIAYARGKGVLTVAAAGNADELNGFDLDDVDVFPVCLSSDTSYGLIGVGSTDRNDRHAPYANYGSCIQVSAPGDDVFGAIPADPSTGAGYSGGFGGTSLAVPLVSGAAALIASVRPDWDWLQIRDRIMTTTDPIDHLQASTYSGKLGRGRLNLAAALSGLAPAVPTPTWAVSGSARGKTTRVRVSDGTKTIEISPFGASDTRGASVAMADTDGDGVQEIIVAPASGKVGDWVIYGIDGAVRAKGTVAKNLKNGLRVAAGAGGLFIADPEGGRAWNIASSGKSALFYPYGSAYHAGLDLVAVPQGVAFTPHGGGGHFTVMDRAGKRMISAFPFGKTARGRWIIAPASNGTFLMSGPTGSVTLDSSGTIIATP